MLTVKVTCRGRSPRSVILVPSSWSRRLGPTVLVPSSSSCGLGSLISVWSSQSHRLGPIVSVRRLGLVVSVLLPRPRRLDLVVSVLSSWFNCLSLVVLVQLSQSCRLGSDVSEKHHPETIGLGRDQGERTGPRRGDGTETRRQD